MSEKTLRVATDVGGTFTDLVAFETDLASGRSRIVTAKTDPTLKTELDNAMAQLFSYNPGFGSDLFDYHFGNAVSQSVGYTQQETEYLARHPVVNVYYETDWTPFEYDRSGEAAGITPDIIRAIGQDTGIAFHFILTSSTKDVYEGVGGEAKDAVMAVSYDYGWQAATTCL